jgi:hypothetical protein
MPGCGFRTVTFGETAARIGKYSFRVEFGAGQRKRRRTKRVRSSARDDAPGNACANVELRLWPKRISALKRFQAKRNAGQKENSTVGCARRRTAALFQRLLADEMLMVAA